jgi:hypothetical protein
MISDVEQLKCNLKTIARTCSSVESSHVLEEMINRGELSCRIKDEQGRPICVWYIDGGSSLLDRIAGTKSTTQRISLELLADGLAEFAADDLGRGLNIYWFARDAQVGPSVQ